MSFRPTELFWARYLAGELWWWERLRLAWAERKSPELRAERLALDARRAAFDHRPEVRHEVDALLGTAPIGQRPKRWGWAIGAALVAAVALVLVARPTDTLRAKGADVFVPMVLRDGRTEPLGPICHPGDAVRARYVTSRGYLLVLGADGRGEVEVLFPPGGDRSAPVDREPGLTPGSWVLDDLPGEQAFVALFSDRPLAAADLGSDAADVVQIRVVCAKEDR